MSTDTLLILCRLANAFSCLSAVLYGLSLTLLYVLQDADFTAERAKLTAVNLAQQQQVSELVQEISRLQLFVVSASARVVSAKMS